MTNCTCNSGILEAKRRCTNEAPWLKPSIPSNGPLKLHDYSELCLDPSLQILNILYLNQEDSLAHASMACIKYKSVNA